MIYTNPQLSNLSKKKNRIAHSTCNKYKNEHEKMYTVP